MIRPFHRDPLVPFALIVVSPIALWLPSVGFAVLAVALWSAATHHRTEGASPFRWLGTATAAICGSAAVAWAIAHAAWGWLLLPLLPPTFAWGWARVRGRGRGALANLVATVATWPLLWLLLGQAAVSGATPFPNDDFLFTLRADPVPAALTDDAERAAVRLVRATIRGEPVPASLPAELAAPSPGRVWVTLWRPAVRARMVRGHSEGPLGDALVAATSAALSSPDGAVFRESGEIRVQIDRAGPLRPIGFRALRELGWAVWSGMGRPIWTPFQYDVEPGVDGFLLRSGDREGVLLPGDALSEGFMSPRDKATRYRLDGWLVMRRHLHERAGLEDGAPWAKGASLASFRTRSFVAPEPASEQTKDVYRQNVLETRNVDEAFLLDAIDRAGRWLLGTVEADGRFDYEYLPHSDDHGQGYNEVRHAGSVYGLFHMANFAAEEPGLRAQRDAYLEAGLRALDRVYRNLGTPPGAGPEFVAFLEGRNGNSTNSGAQALTLLSLLERPAPRPEDRPDLAALLVRPDDDAVRAGLVRTLMAMVDAEGRVWERWTEAKKGGLVVKEPVYYPGELMLALVRDYEGRRDEAVLQTVERVGRAQIRLAQTPGAVPDHWVMQALDRLDALQPENPEWREAAYAMARDYMDEQFPPQLPPFPDYRGSYRRDLEVPRTTRAASRGEALGGVVRIAWRHGDPAGDLERSLVEGARHLTEQMWTPENSWFLPRPKEAEGAIRMGAIDMHCRIDNNQHGVVAMSNALAVLRRSK